MIGRLPLQVRHRRREMHRVLSGACAHLQYFPRRIKDLSELLEDGGFVVLTSLGVGQVSGHRIQFFCAGAENFITRWCISQYLSNYFLFRLYCASEPGEYAKT